MKDYEIRERDWINGLRKAWDIIDEIDVLTREHFTSLDSLKEAKNAIKKAMAQISESY